MMLPQYYGQTSDNDLTNYLLKKKSQRPIMR